MNVEGWTIYGLSANHDAYEYQTLRKAILAGKVTQRHLQEIIGWSTSILINEKDKVIDFVGF